ncbi:MAG: hypothetical protein F4Y80_01085 [Caldilineaceae bacterium SB0665_bin_21]|nr:hypothetical protein [Caldilineaceae bacterium SB0665_bin_21]MYC63352.1 hypothetical protein [Caldilineaceae bacterium SB0661_bin_34]
MTRYLRMVRQARWNRPKWIVGTTVAWQGDALGDLSTTHNVLSVYLADTGERVNQVVAALAANRDNLANLDYVLIEGDLLSQLHLQTMQVSGETFHCSVNELHYDIQDLTAAGVFALMKSITAEDVVRVSRPNVKALLQHAIHDGHIDINRLSARLAQSLES